MRKKRGIWCGLGKFVCTMLLLALCGVSLAQEPVKHFKVKNNTMYIALSKALGDAAIDSFIIKYNLEDIGLKRFMQKGMFDSLGLMGWFIDSTKPDVFVFTKPLEQAKKIWEDQCDVIIAPQKPLTPEQIKEKKKVREQMRLKWGRPYAFKLKGFTDAKKVEIAGDFNDWQRNEFYMEKTHDGWTFSYLLAPGNYQYKFIVDGNWMTDPGNPSIVNDGKGNMNSYLVLGANYEFKLKGYANAKKVFLAGDFNDWSPIGLPMKKVGEEWVCPVYLTPGKHLYKFIVDDHWIVDPSNKNWEENEFGTGNSVVWIEKEV